MAKIFDEIKKYAWIAETVIALVIIVTGFLTLTSLKHDNQTLGYEKNKLTSDLIAAQGQALSLAKLNADNLVEARKQAQIEKDLRIIAEQERDQASKRAAAHTSIRSNIADAKPSDREAPISPVITDTINQLYKDH